MSNFAENPIYVQHEEFVQNLHALIASGQGDSGEADAIRDEMDDTYLALSQDERDRLGGLSADLYMLVDDEIYAKRSPELNSDELRREAERAYRANDWANLLQLMRYGMPWLPPHLIAFMRGRQYDKLGHVRTALLFYEKAVSLNPQYAGYKVIRLGTLERLEDSSAALKYASELTGSPKDDPIPAIFAAGTIHRYSESIQAADTVQSLIPILEAAIASCKRPSGFVEVSDALSYAYAVLAGCFRDMGAIDKAIATWSLALNVSNPNSIWLDYLALGQLKLEINDTEGAATYFEQAVHFGSQAGLPYLFLAHRCFTKDQFGETLKYLKQAIDLDASPIFQSKCWELKGITLAMLSAQPKRVRACFAKAIALTPNDDRIRENQDVFENQHTQQWVPPSISIGEFAIDVPRRIQQTAISAMTNRDERQAA